MCGIAGFTWNDSELIRTMLDRLRHRGPDDEGTYEDDGITLGHRRLSILDLSSHGHQPMLLDDRLVIVHNGEIYNYKELREELEKNGHKFHSNTDTEVILHAYDEWGSSCVKRFNGMWAFVIYDRKKKILFMSRDRFGIKPLYYHISEKGIIFASEIKAILPYRERWSPDERAIFDYLMYNLTDHENFTFFRGIEKIPKAHYAIYDMKSGEMRAERYWKLPEKRRKNISGESEYIRRLLEESVKLRLRSDVPVGSCLSGGIDSSSIVALMRKFVNPSNISTFSAVYPGFERNEERYIDMVVRHLGVKNKKISPDADNLIQDLKRFLYHMEEPTRCTSQYSQYNVMKLAGQNRYKVLLDGQGSDEMLAGYPYFYGYYLYELLKRGRLGKFLSFIVHCRKNMYGKKWKDSFLFLITPKSTKKKLLKKRAPYIKDEFYEKMVGKSEVFDKVVNVKSLSEALKAHMEYKLEQLLKWEDRNAMAFSIETRVPFLDHRLVEYVMSLPSDSIISNCFTKYPLRKEMEKFVPKEVIWRRDKVGFETPEKEWLKEEGVKKFMESIIHSESFRNREYWDAEVVERMWGAHISGKSDYSLHLWKLIFMEMWFRMFIDRTEVLPIGKS